MSIVSSVIAKDLQLGAGRRMIVERFVDSQGRTFEQTTMADDSYDAAAGLAQHAAELQDRLADMEADEVLNG